MTYDFQMRFSFAGLTESEARQWGKRILARTALYMPALSAMRYNSAVIALVDRLKAHGHLKGKQIVIAAMRKLRVLCFVLKTGKELPSVKTAKAKRTAAGLSASAA